MNPLTDILPAKIRKYVYAVVFVASLAWGAFEAADGDVKEFIGLLVVALVNATAASNVNVEVTEE